MWFDMKAWTLSDAKQQQNRISISTTLNCSAERAFNAFSDDEIHLWFSLIKSGRWLSNPKSVNGLRQVNLLPMSVKERFLIWEENKRFTFYMEAINVPLFNRMIEDCQFTEIDDYSCTFDWDIYFEPKLFPTLTAPIVKLINGQMFNQATKELAKYVNR